MPVDDAATLFRVALDLLRKSATPRRGPSGAPNCREPGQYELTLRLYSNHGDVAVFRTKIDVPSRERFECQMTPADSR